ncbi:MAG: glycine cleavage system protein GcvH [Armatimonadetes bacterium]|nr:glycine cleavage system protein GcvH [Armatimonadota bacterium]MDE2205440.1 glycine cleavage system protein GcvH [Armatimonadota bacterium]
MDGQIPNDRAYTPTHEWVKVSNGLATIGITAHAASELGDITYLDLPEPGMAVAAGAKVGEIESVKAVSDFYSPVSGVVTQRNDAIIDSTEVVNQFPYEAGWLICVELSNASELDSLLDSAAYGELPG